MVEPLGPGEPPPRDSARGWETVRIARLRSTILPGGGRSPGSFGVKPRACSRPGRWLTAGVIAAVSIIAFLWMEGRRQLAPPIAVSFDGLHTITDPSYPYGLFTITNGSRETIQWNATIEAPLDTGFEFQQGLSSLRGGGTLPPGKTNQFQMLVAGKDGVTFRIVLELNEPRTRLSRLWVRATETVPLLKRLWSPQHERLYSDWFQATSDRRGERQSAERDGATNGRQPILPETNRTPSAAGAPR